MARRKGSGKGKTIMNSRKSALENARERLKDDPGGTTQARQSQQQQQKNLSNSNMEAASTTTTTKHYNKTAKLQNNHHRSAERRGSYRTHSDGAETLAGGDNVKLQKQTAKQAKAAIRTAATAADAIESRKATTAGDPIKDPLAIGADTGSKTATSRVKDAKGEQKTVGKSLETTAANVNNNSNNNNAAVSSSNSKQSDNSNSSSSRNNLSTLSRGDKSRQQQQPEQQDVSNKNSDKKTSTATVANNKSSESAMGAASSAVPTTETNSWNNARYLHKKFKRLASTTDVDSLVAAESQSLNAAGSSASSEAGSERAQIRTTSLSSSSSSASTSSISPPPARTPTPAVAATMQSSASAINNEQISSVKMVTNGEPHTSSIATEETSNNNANIVKHTGALAVNAGSGSKFESHRCNKDTSTQQLDVEQLPQTMLQLLESQHSQSAVSSSNSTAPNAAAANTGRYVCPYCNLNCTKPSVLQKHIRAHTNERPYPCDICGIAFKTNSNYYKHCRSRSHAARKRGIEVPISAEDGLFGGSDQEGDPELSNSSSDVISRTASPLEEASNVVSPALLSTNAPANNLSQQQLQQLQQQQQKQIQLQQQQVNARQSPHLTLPSTLSPSSLSSTKSTYLQQPASQQTQQLPLGSPAAGTLPPPPSTNTSGAVTTVTAVGTTKDTGSTSEYKPYKPKFHNAALYASIKEAAAKAANAGVVPPPSLLQPLSLQHQPLSHQQLAQAPTTNNIPTPPAVHLTAILPQSQTPLTPPPPTTAHHPSLSPSTQVKLNNHINTHQLQLQMQQQQLPQALHVLPPLNTGIPLHHVGPLPPKNAVQRPDMINAVAVAAAAAANMGYMPATRVLYPGCIDFPPEALHMMMPDSRQKLHYPYKWLEQEFQQHFHKVTQQQQQQLQHVPLTHAPPTPPTVVKSNITQTVHNRAPSGPQAQLAGSALVTSMQQMPIGGTTLPPTQQTALPYLTNTSTASAVGVVSSASSSTTPTISPGLLHSNISNAVQEHITKLISQNEAIVENKAVLLQKKYPKGLSRSRSFNNSGGGANLSGSTSGSTSNAGGSANLVTTTSAGGSESVTNAKLAQAIVQKQQQQQLQQQLQQQQHYQQQFQQQLLAGAQAMQMPPPAKQQQQHLAQLRLEEQVQQHHQQQQPIPQQQHMQPNGISKHLTLASVATKPSNITSVQPHHHQQHPMTVTYRQQQQPVIASAGMPTQDTRRSTPPPSIAQQTTYVASQKDIMNAMKQSNTLPTSIANINVLPLNLSAKPKARQEEQTEIIPASTPSSTPQKRQSIETQISNSSNDGSTSSSTAVATIAPSSGTTYTKQPTNVSIIKNLLLNARGLAVPTGEGDDAVYNCPLCANTFRTAEDLQLHNSTYCQGASSAPISPVGSPSYRYFRSNSMTLNLPELKNTIFRSRDPLPLAKLAWYQLRTKPSSLVLSRLSASQAGSSKATTTTTTSATSTAPTSSTSSSGVASCVASPRSTPPSGLPSVLTLPDPNIVRLIDAPLPSPGPLLGKTPLVDFGNTSEARKSEDVIITKMHEDRQFDSHMLSAKRPKIAFDNSESSLLASASASSGSTTTSASSKRLNINTISGGDMQLLSNSGTSDLVKKEERIRRFTSSGGCIIPLSECSDVDKSPKMIRTPLLSGGSFQEVSPKPKDKENKNVLSCLPFSNSSAFTPKMGLNGLGLPSNGPPSFQFSINPITAFNPLTLPPLHNMSGGGEKIIPHVPGIPGPNSLTPQLPPPQHLQLPQVSSQILSGGRSLSPNRKKTQSPMLMSNSVSPKTLALPPQENLKSSSPFKGMPSEFERGSAVTSVRSARNSNQNIPPNSSTKSFYNNSLEVPKKTFNFTRMADNISPRKVSSVNVPKSSPPENEVRHFNFDHLSKDGQGNAPANSTLTPLHVDITSSSAGTSANSSGSDPTDTEIKKNKFLRPTSLPLKPGTFTPKRHHGITPTANTLPLISPETPRQSKSCVQLYLNGHAYTYLGLKCSTKMFYCTVNCPQASYVAGAQKLSMYSVWKVCAENNPHPLGFKPKLVMSLYDSRQKTSTSTMAGTNRMPYTLVVSQHTVMTPFENNQGQYHHHHLKQISVNTNTTESGDQLKKTNTSSSGSVEGGVKKEPATGQMLVGGYESHEDYTYIRGRGRGRYVCSECGIRCKKPSMLKKHIRTHTDVRPYTCKHCNFSFKTKGNLTKHMQSKTHFKKCLELGINPGPMPADGEFLEPEPEFDQQSTTSAGGRTSSIPGESDSDDYSDNESESSDTDESKSRLLEHEAARCLLSLSMTPPIGQSISPHPKSEPYPYQQNETTAISFVGHPNIVTATTANSTHPTGIKRVISFSSPKPPFDYQKQEQYYSNPEESKPKHNNNTASSSYESAPIDLTKPRVVPNSTPLATTAVVTATETIVTSTTTVEEFSSNNSVSLPSPPVQTQAQIRDVIFGGSNNESGFLKTLISVSDKVRSSTEMLESYKNSDELSQAYQYHKAFQYHKIKQIQMNQSFPDAINVSAINQSFASTPAMITVSVASAELGSALTTAASANNGIRVSDSIAPITVLANERTETAVGSVNSNTVNSIGYKPLGSATNETNEKSTTDLSIPVIELSKVPTEDSKNDQDVPTIPSNTKANAPSSVSGSKTSSSIKSTGVTISAKSSDEGEDSECISDQEQTTVAKRSRSISNSASVNSSANAESHNAKLPAVVAQPGTTEFTGVLSAPGRKVVVGEDGLKNSGNKEIQPVYPRGRISPDGRPVCKVCAKTFQTQGQLSLHMNIHYMERKFRCEPCGVSFRTQGHLQKHERAEAHKNKVMMTSTFGVPTTSNPRPFECTDCKIAFRIHGHLAKHLRSKTHVQKLECLQKLPFGTYAEIERAGISLTEIDTSDCENSLISLKTLAQKLIEKDPNKLGSYTTPSGMGAVSGSGSGGLVESSSLNTNHNHNAIVSQDSASEDGFSAATIAAATAIASLDNDSATNTPKRANSTSEDEAIANGLNNSLKRRLPGNFSNGEESDNPTEGTSSEKRARISSLSSMGTASAMAAIGSPASITSSNASSNN